jgi:PPOX class probable F420-dependent enzyme
VTDELAPGLERFRHTKTIALTSYRWNGTPVTTPVSIAFEGGRAFFRTYDRAGKAKRLRGSPDVEIAPSTFRGEATGPRLPAQVRLLVGDEAKQARRALRRRHPVLQGVFVPLSHRLARYRTLHYELTPRS